MARSHAEAGRLARFFAPRRGSSARGNNRTIGRRRGEIGLDLAPNAGLVGLDGEQVVGTGVADSRDDGVDGDEGAGRLADYEARVCGEGRDQVQRRALLSWLRRELSPSQSS